MSCASRAVLSAIVGLSTLVAAPPRALAEPASLVTYRPPVDAPVSDPFRPPANPFGPGNRGIEYATAPASPVRAVAPGEVTFAGRVGGTLHVTVLHADGLRSTVSYLDSVVVRRGEVVDAGQLLGTSGPRTHLGVRAGDEYLDPAALFSGTVTPAVRLIPTESAVSSSVAAERAAIAAWLAARPTFAERSADWLRGRMDDLAILAEVRPLDPTRLALSTGFELLQRFADRPRCTPAEQGVPAPVGRRVVVLVGGLQSSSTNAAIDEVDVVALGYEQSDVYRFSYAGGRIPDRDDRHQELPAVAYDAEHTHIDLEVSGARLRALVEHLARLEPDTTIDVISHSQGGVVARVAVNEMARHGGGGSLGAVVTIGTPHLGADLATAGAAVRLDTAASTLFETVEGVLDTEVDLASPALRQLAVGSPLMVDLDRAGVPAGVELTSIGARGDLVVAAPRTHLDGAGNVVLPIAGLRAHDALPSDPATTREIGLALAGRPPTCESAGDIVLDVLGGTMVSESEQLLAAGLLAGGLMAPG